MSHLSENIPLEQLPDLRIHRVFGTLNCRGTPGYAGVGRMGSMDHFYHARSSFWNPVSCARIFRPGVNKKSSALDGIDEQGYSLQGLLHAG